MSNPTKSTFRQQFRALLTNNPEISFKQALVQSGLATSISAAKKHPQYRIWQNKFNLERQSIKGSTAAPVEHTKPEKPEPTVEELVQIDLQSNNEGRKYRELKKKYDWVIKDNEEWQKRFEVALAIKEPVPILRIEPLAEGTKDEATAMVALSDWHFEERVDSHKINGLNEYNLDIARARWNKCIQNSLRLVAKERYTSNVNHLLLWLGGDFITGYIHDELKEGNYLSPIEAVRFAKQRIIEAIEFYAKHGNFEKMTIVCNDGNHGRNTPKLQVSTRAMNSLEWMMYNDIRQYFCNHSQITFHICDGIFNYVQVYDLTIRFLHGDIVKSHGGIGSLTIPLIKAIGRWDQSIHADYNVMGHYHQFWEATKKCMVNGSGIGYGAYAQSIGASPEPPLQGFRIIDRKRGFTTRLPIFCE
jgi:hypothetical protein